MSARVSAGPTGSPMTNQSVATAMSGTLPGVTETVASFAAMLAYDDVPEIVMHRIKLHLLDTLACAFAGRGLDISRSARRVADRMGAGGACRVFGAAAGVSPVAAAFANSVIANALDFDDGFEINGKGMGHPSSSLVAAALAALGADAAAVDGRTFLAALAAAYEINNRLILSMQPTARRFQEVYGIAQHQTMGAAIAFGRLSGLDTAGLRNALGLAGALTPLPSLHKYNWRTRPIISLKDGVAPAAQSGVQAALMAREGFVGSTDMLDGPQGYWRMIGSDRFEPSVLTSGLGHDWFAARGSFKLYPACRWLAPAIEAFETTFRASGARPQDISAIAVTSFGLIPEKLMSPAPLNAIDAQFSLPFILGAIATGRPAGPDWFTSAAFADPVLHQVAGKVSAQVDPQMDQLMSGETRRPSASAQLTLHDGRVFSHGADAPLGGETRPVEDAVILRKAAHNLTGLGMSAEAFVEHVMMLEQSRDVAATVAPLFG